MTGLGNTYGVHELFEIIDEIEYRIEYEAMLAKTLRCLAAVTFAVPFLALNDYYNEDCYGYTSYCDYTPYYGPYFEYEEVFL